MANPTNFFRVCSRKASKSFCLFIEKTVRYSFTNWIAYRTFGTQGNSFIIKVDAGSTLDASLANEVVDSDELNVEADDETRVVPSSSVDELFVLVDPSSLTASESNADCLVKLYQKRMR